MNLYILTELDRTALLRLDKSTNSHPWHPSQWDYSLSRHLCLGLEENGLLVGACVTQNVLDEAELLQIAILPDRQGTGCGCVLLKGLICHLRQANVERLFLEVRVSNTRAKRFYTAMGFTHIGQRAHYYPAVHGREDALVYVLELIPS